MNFVPWIAYEWIKYPLRCEMAFTEGGENEKGKLKLNANANLKSS